VLQYQQELKRRDCKLSVGGYLLGWPRAAVSDYAASSVTALPFESLYCSVQGAPRRAKGKTLSGASSACVVANPSFFYGGKRGIRSACGVSGDLSACGYCLLAQICTLVKWLCMKINFHHIIFQPQQSSIAIAPLRPPLDFCRRSNRS
jgi:hypothetical protein